MKVLVSALALSIAGSFNAHVDYLASDALEGRAPGTPGGDAAARYVLAQFERAGLATRWQEVPLIGRTSQLDEETLVLVIDDREQPVPRSAFALASETIEPTVELTTRLVRIGEDLTGALVLVGDPHELELAREGGASGVLSITDDRPSQDFEKLLAGWTDDEVLRVRGWIDEGYLPPSELVTVRLRHRAGVRRFASPNVIGVLDGSNPDAGALVVTAHYDGFGVGPSDASGDTIYNGAIDNAAGVAALIELARHFAAREDELDRSIIFVATTAEERGTLGARYYIDHPVVPLEQTTLVLNVDGVNVLAPTDDFVVFPSVGTETADAMTSIAQRTGMTLTVEPWHSGMHFAFDTAPFLRRGLVGLTLWQGSAYRDVSKETIGRYLRRVRRMHTPQDEWSGPGNLHAVEQHLELYAAAIEHFAAASTPRPTLSHDHPFGGPSP